MDYQKKGGKFKPALAVVEVSLYRKKTGRRRVSDGREFPDGRKI